MASMTPNHSILSLVKMMVILGGLIANDATAIEATSKNNDKAHHHGPTLETVKHLRNSNDGLAALPSHLTGFAESFHPNLAKFAQKQQHAEHMLELMKSSSSDHSDHDSHSDDKCPDGAKFSITAPAVPRITGCFKDTGGDLFEETVYSLTGKGVIKNEAFVFAYKNFAEVDETGKPIDLWLVVYAVSPTEVYAYCGSLDAASDVQPADVETWYCDLELTGAVEEADEDEFKVDCGC